MLRKKALSLFVSAMLAIGICCLAQDIFAQSAPGTANLSGL